MDLHLTCLPNFILECVPSYEIFSALPAVVDLALLPIGDTAFLNRSHLTCKHDLISCQHFSIGTNSFSETSIPCRSVDQLSSRMKFGKAIADGLAAVSAQPG